MKRITQDEIDILQKETAHADIGDLGITLEDDSPAELVEDLRIYMNQFAKPTDGRPCLACGERMGGFTWGLTHGHGHCRNCRWPATLYHFIKDRNGNDLLTVHGVLLQVHPSEVSLRKQEQ